MPYTAEISRANPLCCLFLIDRSASMDEDWAGELGKKKADGLATIINRLLQNLVLRCSKGPEVWNYFDIGVIGYGARVGSAFGGQLGGRDLVSISDIANFPIRIENRTRKTDDGAGGLVEETLKLPIWFDPVADDGTPLCQAFTYARDILSKWIDDHRNSFPPILINITDGESTDGDPTKIVNAIKNLQTNDGAALVFNIHLSAVYSEPILFPDSENGLPDEHARSLFRLSSALPLSMRASAWQMGITASEQSRGFAFNANPVAVIQFLDIGSRVSNMS